MATSGFIPGGIGRIEVQDVVLAQKIRENVVGVDVVVRDELPAVAMFLRAMADQFDKGAPPDPMALRGMTMQIMLDFAEAAKAFYLAAPWRILSSDDFLRVVTPDSPLPSTTCCSVMGSAGKTFGLGFFRSVESFTQMMNGHSFDQMTAGRESLSLCYGSSSHAPYW